MHVPKRFTAILLVAAVVSGLMFCAGGASARPRPPLPPYPEWVGPRLFHESFDWACSHGRTNAEVVIAGYGTLRASWSGMALQRSGPVTPFVVPGIDANGHTNVASHVQSSARFWLTPSWASASLSNGMGPGTAATLAQLVALDSKEAAVIWSLEGSPDGGALVLLGQTEAGPVELLKADMVWAAGTAHCVALNFGPEGTALFVDGQLVAQGEGTLGVPPKVAALVFGSDWSGNGSAEADFEDVCVFGRPLTEAAIAFYYAAHAQQAGLGPISEAEWQARREAAAQRNAERAGALAATEGGGGETMLLIGGTSTCLTNVPVHLTNLVCVFDTNWGWTVTFDIQGGTNGSLYDVFTTTSLTSNSIADSQWVWLERGPTCSTYQYANQPAAQAFYVLGTPQDSDGDGLTDAYERLVSKSDPSDPDSDDDGFDDRWEWENGMSPTVNEAADPVANGKNYTFDDAGRLTGVPHRVQVSVTLDEEGNITHIAP